MTVDVRALAIRFADLWAVDPHQMVDEIYAADIVMENMVRPERCIRGAAELHAVEDRLAALIADHRHELIRVVASGSTACLETTVVAPLSHEYAPACVWWWIDGAGQVGVEVGWFDWEQRVRDSAVSHGTVPAWHASTASVAVAHEYAHGWSTDPLGSGLAMFAPDCTTGRVGFPERAGLDALHVDRSAELQLLPLGTRRMDVQAAIAEGACVAMLVLIGDDERATRGTILLTVETNGRIVSERRYLDWARAVPRRRLEAVSGDAGA